MVGCPGDDEGRMTALGLVLGGGGARGLAHIGVLRALAEVDVHPDVIVGVSMGAVVGATYAARTDWVEALQGIDRRSLPGHGDLFDAEGFALVRSVVRSAVHMAPKVVTFGRSGGFEDFGRDTMRHLLDGDPTFDDLRLPFAAVATDVGRGDRAVLQTGPVASAVIASAALPIVTRSIQRDGSRFLDGGFADPAPIDVARGLGADVVVMVHVGTAMGSEESDGEGVLGGMLRGFEIGLQRFVDVRTREADLLIVPQFAAGTSWLSFDRADQLAGAGHAAMRAHLPVLLGLLGR
jgi:NTE family protein